MKAYVKKKPMRETRMGAAGVTKPRLKQKAHRQLDLSISSNTNLIAYSRSERTERACVAQAKRRSGLCAGARGSGEVCGRRTVPALA